ncbi:proline utilization trans-activator [Microdochium nivale]|nr:proline utilization trans-activator [Microdochium nivale]
MDTPLTVGDGVDNLKIWSCTTCRRRKVKCDRHSPCTPCLRNKAECVFPVSGRVPRRGRLGGLSAATHRNTGLLGRLRHLEALVSDLGSQVEVAVSAPSDENGNEDDVMYSSAEQEFDLGAAQLQVHGQDTSISSSSSNSREIGFGQPIPNPDVGDLVAQENGDVIVEDKFWTIFCSEVEQIFEAVRDRSRPPFFAQHDAKERSHLGYFSYLLGRTDSGTTGSIGDFYPMPSQLLFIWHTFEERVDPIVKVLHKPTMAEIIRNQTGDWATIEIHVGALILAVSYAAISAFDEDEVLKNFGFSKPQLLARFRLGTEQAFQQCNLLTTKDLRVLQAYIIYLNVVQRSGEAELAWPLVGMLVRVAVRLQLHQDGRQFSELSGFEIEMRRRLWWNICLLDSQSGGAPRSSLFLISEGMFTTRRPLSVNDVAIGVGSSAIEESEVSTDMTATLARLDMWAILQQLRALTTDSATPESFDSFAHHARNICQNYTERLISSQQPLTRFIATMARLSLTRIELYLRQRALGANMQSTEIVQAAVLILQDVSELRHEPSWRLWRWLLPAFSTPWLALHVVLKHISEQGNCGTLARAWSAVETTFAAIPDEDKGKPQYESLLRLKSMTSTEFSSIHIPATIGHGLEAVPHRHMEAASTSNIPIFLGPEVSFAPDNTGLPLMGDPVDWRSWEFEDWTYF